MVSIQMKDLFMAKSSLQRIDQLLGMRDKDMLCLVQAEESVIYLEIWSKEQERILMQKKVLLHNYELSSNLVALESNQLAFYGVIQNNGAQCLFLVDIIPDEGGGGHQNLVKEQLLNAGVSKEVANSMVQEMEMEKQANSKGINSNLEQVKKTQSAQTEVQLTQKNLAQSLGKENQEEQKQDDKNQKKNMESKGSIAQYYTDGGGGGASMLEDINCITNFEHYQRGLMSGTLDSVSMSDKDDFDDGFSESNESSQISSNKQPNQNMSNTNSSQNFLQNITKSQENSHKQPSRSSQISSISHASRISKDSSQSRNSKVSEVTSASIECSSTSDYSIDYQYQYIGTQKDMRCIYDVDQRKLFENCSEFFSEVTCTGYKETILVKNTYFLSNKDDTYYLLLVLSVYRAANLQRFAQYVIRRDVSPDFRHGIQVISVLNAHELIVYDPVSEEIVIWSYFSDNSLFPMTYPFQQFETFQIRFAVKGTDSVYHFIYRDATNLFKLFNYDFQAGMNTTQSFHNSELSRIRTPIIVRQQEAFVMRQQDGELLLVICSIYAQHEMTTFWNVYQLQEPIVLWNEDQKQRGVYVRRNSQLKSSLRAEVLRHLESSETDNSDVKTHFVPTFSLISPNIYFFNTADIHVDVQQAINTFIFNRDIHFKAIQIFNNESVFSERQDSMS